MITIQDLHVEVDGKPILNGINLNARAGEIHAIMGPNGSGKSTLSHVLAGRDGYNVTQGTVQFKGEDLLPMAPEERARAGLFLAFQYPVEIPGVSNIQLLKAAVNARRRHQGLEEWDAFDFLQQVQEGMALVGMKEEFLQRPVNDGFSGGEKKRNEILQMTLLEPELAILDETDSGLDIDALSIIAQGINRMRNSKRTFLMVTHYQRLLNYVKPDFVHVLVDGRVVKSAGAELALQLEESGYGWITEEVAA